MIFSFIKYIFFICIWFYRYKISINGDVKKGKPEHYRNGVRCYNIPEKGSLSEFGHVRRASYNFPYSVSAEFTDTSSWKEPSVPLSYTHASFFSHDNPQTADACKSKSNLFYKRKRLLFPTFELKAGLRNPFKRKARVEGGLLPALENVGTSKAE